MNDNNEIRFWGTNSKYFEFSNFYLRKVVLDDIEWPTSEHYYQAQKFIANPDIIYKILKEPYPYMIYKMANKIYKDKQRQDWHEVKIDIMRKVVLAKFTQHEDLKNLLFETGNSIIIENSPTDSFWGVGGFGNKYIDNKNNWLGKILMEVRDKLKN